MQEECLLLTFHLHCADPNNSSFALFQRVGAESSSQRPGSAGLRGYERRKSQGELEIDEVKQLKVFMKERENHIRKTSLAEVEKTKKEKDKEVKSM